MGNPDFKYIIWINSLLRFLPKILINIGIAGVFNDKNMSELKNTQSHRWELFEKIKTFFSGITKIKILMSFRDDDLHEDCCIFLRTEGFLKKWDDLIK